MKVAETFIVVLSSTFFCMFLGAFVGMATTTTVVYTDFGNSGSGALVGLDYAVAGGSGVVSSLYGGLMGGLFGTLGGVVTGLALAALIGHKRRPVTTTSDDSEQAPWACPSCAAKNHFKSPVCSSCKYSIL